MDDLGVTSGDLFVALILLVSGLFGMMRGLVREVLSIVTWVGAIVVTVYGYFDVQVMMRRVFDNPVVADVSTGIGLFILTFLLITTIAGFLTDQVEESAASPLDKMGGFGFGLGRGVLIISIGYLVFTGVVAVDKHPDWLVRARSLPYIVQSADYIKSLTEGSLPYGQVFEEETMQNLSNDVHEGTDPVDIQNGSVFEAN